MKKTNHFFLIIAVLLILATSIFPQASGATGISGSVSDLQGAVVPGATVTLSNSAKGFTRTAVTNGNGVYNFAGIQPDVYTLEIEKTGFKKYVQNDLRAAVDTPLEINAKLEIGAVSEVVTVNSNTIDSVVNTQDASIGNSFQPVQIQQLPTDSRQVNSLLSLQPGVTREGYTNGGRSDQTNIMLDGVDNNDQQQGTAGGLHVEQANNVGSPLPNSATNTFFSVLRATAESLDEFRVTTASPNANQGRSSGAQISLITKSGTNQFHGAGFYVHRDTNWSANDFFNNRAGVERPNIDRDVFGGAVGGPVWKNKVFFFYSYEGWREQKDASIVTTVPLASLGQGILKLQDNDGIVQTITPAQFTSIFPDAGQNPTALAALASAAARYPANDFQSGFGDNVNTAGFRFNTPVSYEQNTHILRLDWNINANQQLFARANKQHDVEIGNSAFPDTPQQENWEHNTGLAIGHNWTIGSTKINSFRYGLTRQAFTAGGDSNQDRIVFRFVFSPLNFLYSLSRVTPVQNFTDDFTWTVGKHTAQFGGNVRIVRNKRQDSAPGFSQAVINPSFYDGSGRSLLNPLVDAGYNISNTDLLKQAAVASLIGRYSDYTAEFNYDKDGSLLPPGTVVNRNFATEEYEMYAQDSWKPRQSLIINYGLRYSLSRPVYEKDGFQIRPTIPLGDYFDQRVFGASVGAPFNDPLNFELAGPANNAKGFYGLDTNNFQPRVSVAWSPRFKSGFWGKLFGKDNESVLRGGFSMTNDAFGEQLAVSFNNLSTLGFLTSDSIPANFYSVDAGTLGPLFTGFNQSVIGLPNVAPLENRFLTPADGAARIESSLDSKLVSPTNYSWSVTYGRKLPKGLYIEASYIGHMARHLLLQRDAMQLNNLTDPRSGMDWYTAAGRIYDLFYSGTDVNAVQPIPYFENMFPGLGAMLPSVFGLDPEPNSTRAVYSLNNNFSFGDWTFLQQLLDDDLSGGGAWNDLFFQPQYGAFEAFSTVGRSDYHGASLSIRQRFGNSVMFDLNYTFSKSFDDSSGLQSSRAYDTAFLLNPIRQKDSYAPSDFDARHVLNFNGLFQLPFGKGQRFFNSTNKWVNGIIGGWQLGSIFRLNSGLPIWNLTDLAGWATNWEIRSRAVRTQPIETSPTRENLFSDLNALLNSVRPPRPGETGDRNVFRGTWFTQLDLNLGKTFSMPWNENHKLQFRIEAFNVMNYQYMDENTVPPGFAASWDDPFLAGNQTRLSDGGGQFAGIKGIPRRMQIFFRYSF